MAGARALVASVALCASAFAWQPHVGAAPAVRPPLRSRHIIAMADKRLTFDEAKKQKEDIQAALDRANDKLDSLNQVEKLAPTSWGDAGLPLEAPPDVGVPGWLTTLPNVIAVFALGLFLLNQLGIFGEGPDIDALAEEWSKL